MINYFECQTTIKNAISKLVFKRKKNQNLYRSDVCTSQTFRSRLLVERSFCFAAALFSLKRENYFSTEKGCRFGKPPPPYTQWSEILNLVHPQKSFFSRQKTKKVI